MQQQARGARPRRGIGHWYGQKKVVLSPAAAKDMKERHAKFQEDLAGERARVEALRSHPDLACSCCGAPWVAGSCSKRCTSAILGRQRSHAVVSVPQAEIPLPQAPVADAAPPPPQDVLPSFDEP
jgi:hypothetical protein